MKKQPSRALEALLLAAITLLTIGVISAAFCLISNNGNFLNDFVTIYKIVFGAFGIGPLISAFLILGTGLQSNLAFNFGVILHWGTFLIAYGAIELFQSPEDIALLFSAVIVSLLEYIYWLKNKE